MSDDDVKYVERIRKWRGAEQTEASNAEKD